MDLGLAWHMTSLIQYRLPVESASTTFVDIVILYAVTLVPFRCGVNYFQSVRHLKWVRTAATGKRGNILSEQYDRKTGSKPSTEGVLMRAANGDVLRVDETGVVLRLSDRVLSDIALRLDLGSSSTETALPSLPQEQPTYPDPHEFMPGIDAWNLSRRGDWLHFTACLPGWQGVRGFRRLADGGPITADAAGPIVGLLGIGGPRAALAIDRASHFPWHVLAPADDIGAVGHAATETAAPCNAAESLREVTHEALLAECLLSDHLSHHRPLPLFVTRVETDASACALDLTQGRAVENLLIAAHNIVRIAASMGKSAILPAITIDYAFEDQSGNPTAYRDGMIALMTRLSEGLAILGFHHPRFLALFDGGSAEMAAQSNANAVVEGQWELGWNHGDHRFAYSAPGYMFALDAYDRATASAQEAKAAITAAALADPDWHCPTFLLAEREDGAPNRIRVTAKAMEWLEVDHDDPLGAGPGAGFDVTGDTAGAQITDVSISADDPKSLILTFDTAPDGPDLAITYALGSTRRGALRDAWDHETAAGTRLHRWALPCRLPISGHAA